MRISDWSSDVCSSDLLGGEGEDDVEIADRKQVGLAGLEPGACGGALASGAVPVPATVVRDPPVAAVGTGLDVPAESGGAAMLDRRHDLELVQAPMPGKGGAIGRSSSPDNIDRKSVVEGKRGYGRVDLGGRRNIKKKTNT